MNFFQVDVRYVRKTGEDNPVKTKELFLVKDAVTCSDAEKAVMDEIKPFVFGKCDTPKIQRRSFFAVFCDTEHDNFYYDAKVEMIVINGDKELRKTVSILVTADSFSDAFTCLSLNTDQYDGEIISLRKIAITDILIPSPAGV